jgi:hypothetical protein
MKGKTMNISQSFKKLKEGKVLSAVAKVLSSKFFPFITAIVSLLSYYFGLDIINIYYLAICGILVLVLLDDASPIITLFIFMDVMISDQNTPQNRTTEAAANHSDYYFQTAILAQIIVLIAIYALVVFIKIGVCVKRKQFKLTPVFFGLCAFAVTLLANSIFSENYTIMNTVYGLFLAFFFLGIFTLGC